MSTQQVHWGRTGYRNLNLTVQEIPNSVITSQVQNSGSDLASHTALTFSQVKHKNGNVQAKTSKGSCGHSLGEGSGIMPKSQRHGGFSKHLCPIPNRNWWQISAQQFSFGCIWLWMGKTVSSWPVPSVSIHWSHWQNSQISLCVHPPAVVLVAKDSCHCMRGHGSPGSLQAKRHLPWGLQTLGHKE